MAPVVKLRPTDVAVYTLGAWLLVKLLNSGLSKLRRRQATPLRGPSNPSFFTGLEYAIDDAEDPAALVEQWANDYGRVFRLSRSLRSSPRIILVDPQAVAHFYAEDSFGYVQNPIGKDFIERFFGRGLLFVDGEAHRRIGVQFRQRKALSPAFNNTSIRRLTSLKEHWDTILDTASGDAQIDIRKWLSNLALDSIGIAGFGHDFGCLDGNVPIFARIYGSLNSSAGKADMKSFLISLLAPIMPFLLRMSTTKNQVWTELRTALAKIADDLLERTQKDRESGLMEEKSIIGLLVAEETSAEAERAMTHDEIIAQNVLLLAGFQTISTSLTWALIELAKNPKEQQRLREELSQFSTAEPTWEQLVSDFPFLDAVVHETLRLYPVVTHTSRVAAKDDIVPLSTSIVTASGDRVSSVVVEEGTLVSIPIRAINRSEAFWGPDSEEFKPERWLEGLDVPAKQFQGHRHLFTFADGPRKCLGRGFALAEFKVRLFGIVPSSYVKLMDISVVFLKVVLSVLIRNYTFDLPDGPNTKIEIHRSILPGPKIGKDGVKVPMRVRRVV
ncbi:hypothetical protein H0H92_006205 [Tricholoma furcatifolium]|nr:hypothetical protein H0H92_006205 [Tricholoma furcatifolium]